jgi:hypothetical protein
MQDVMDAENRLSSIAWLLRGDGRGRTRSYEFTASAQKDEITGALDAVISERIDAARLTSATGLGSKRAAGSVVDGAFWARLYSPGDAWVADWARVTIGGVVKETAADECWVGLQIRPSLIGIVASMVGLLLGLIAIGVGIAAFAVHSEWRDWGIATGIGLALIGVFLILLAWGVYEGRNNEREFLGLLAPCLGDAT